MAKSSSRAGKSSLPTQPEPTGTTSLPLAESARQIAAALGFLVLQASPHKDAKNPAKISFLTKFGFDPDQIAAIIDSTPGTVRKEQSILRTSKGKEANTKD